MWNTPMYSTSKLTVELREIVESGVNVWDFEYPSFYSGDDKTAFEQKVLDHYWFRQIGQETTGRFLHYFRARIREIMPYYIKMYESVEIMNQLDNPFDNVDIVETFEQTSSGTQSGTNSEKDSASASGSQKVSGSDSRTGSEDKTHKYSNTPQGSISNLDRYLTEGSVDENTSTDNGTSEQSGTSESESSSERSGTHSTTSEETLKHTYTKKGNQGVNTYAHDMNEFRTSIIDVDMMIINQLQDLFLAVY